MKVKAWPHFQDSPIFFVRENSFKNGGGKIELSFNKYAAEGCDFNCNSQEIFCSWISSGFSFGAKVGYRTDEGKKKFYLLIIL